MNDTKNKEKNIRKPINTALMVGMLVSALSACGTTSPAVLDVAFTPMESVAVIDYTVPKSTANVLVDRRGYRTDGLKEAAFLGSELPEEFHICDAQTKETVYTGKLTNIEYVESEGRYIGYGNFDDLAAEGKYYIECDIIGRSYDFRVSKDIYRETFEELYEEYVDAIRNKTADIDNVTALLIAYEWHNEIYEDDNENSIPDVLEYIREWIRNIDYSKIDEKEGVKYAAFLAKFSYLYQNYDRGYATECIQRASAVFNQSKGAHEADGELFFALAELYRATGLYTYSSRILEYKEYLLGSTDFISEQGYLYGSMTYMVTRQRVDSELCGQMMTTLTDRGENISDTYKDIIKPLGARNSGADDVLDKAVELLCANYVFKSYQYNCIEEEFAHYLMGRNVNSIIYYPDSGDKDKYLLLFALTAELYDM